MKKMAKIIIALLLALSMMLLASCGDDNKSKNPNGNLPIIDLPIND